MIKFVVAAVWICAATVGAVFFAFEQSRGTAEDSGKPAYFGGLDYVKTEVISVPVIVEGHIHGYFLARLVYTAEPGMLKKLSLPAEALLIDHVYDYLFDNPQIDFSRLKSIDLDAFRSGIRESVNARVGEKLIHEVLVEQLDYLGKSEVRDNQAWRHSTRG